MRRIGDALASVGGMIWDAFWAIGLGVIALWAFFISLDAIALSEPLWLTITMGVLAVLAALHFAHVRDALADHRYEELARHAHMLRERRGF